MKSIFPIKFSVQIKKVIRAKYIAVFEDSTKGENFLIILYRLYFECVIYNITMYAFAVYIPYIYKYIYYIYCIYMIYIYTYIIYNMM